jgi:zinc transport system substrate-binding protein
MTKKIISLLIIILLVGGFIYWGINEGGQSEEVSSQPVVFTSIYPLYFTANQIAGDKLDVRLVVPNGTEIHSYDPSPKKIAQLEEADLLFYNGLGLEPWASRLKKNLSGKRIKLINVSEIEGVKLLAAEERKTNLNAKDAAHHHEDSVNEHGEHSEETTSHDHGTKYDPHLWLDPINLQQIASRMWEEFSGLDPSNEGVYEENYRQFSRKIETLDKEYRENLVVTDDDYILVSHAAFSYLADRYNFKQLAVMGVTPHEEPTPQRLTKIIDRIAEHDLQYVFKEELADSASIDMIAEEAGLEVLTLNPAAGLTPAQNEAGEDYFSLMRQNLANLQEALGDNNETDS